MLSMLVIRRTDVGVVASDIGRGRSFALIGQCEVKVVGFGKDEDIGENFPSAERD